MEKEKILDVLFAIAAIAIVGQTLWKIHEVWRSWRNPSLPPTDPNAPTPATPPSVGFFTRLKAWWEAEAKQDGPIATIVRMVGAVLFLSAAIAAILWCSLSGLQLEATVVAIGILAGTTAWLWALSERGHNWNPKMKIFGFLWTWPLFVLYLTCTVPWLASFLGETLPNRFLSDHPVLLLDLFSWIVWALVWWGGILYGIRSIGFVPEDYFLGEVIFGTALPLHVYFYFWLPYGATRVVVVNTKSHITHVSWEEPPPAEKEKGKKGQAKSEKFQCADGLYLTVEAFVLTHVEDGRKVLKIPYKELHERIRGILTENLREGFKKLTEDEIVKREPKCIDLLRKTAEKINELIRENGVEFSSAKEENSITLKSVLPSPEVQATRAKEAQEEAQQKQLKRQREGTNTRAKELVAQGVDPTKAYELSAAEDPDTGITASVRDVSFNAGPTVPEEQKDLTAGLAGAQAAMGEEGADRPPSRDGKRSGRKPNKKQLRQQRNKERKQNGGQNGDNE
ncbi:MAG: SPFH domain-containing protein [Patescibacteria group bacterium]